MTEPVTAPKVATTKGAKGERITAHMQTHLDHTHAQIAEHVGVTASTVRRHLAKLRAQDSAVS